MRVRTGTQSNELIDRMIRSGSRLAAEGGSFASKALHLFGCPAEDDLSPAFAAVSYLGIVGHRPAEWCLRLDPGHLQPRRSQLFLIAGDSLSVTQSEAASLVSDISELYKDSGWVVSAPHPQQWFVELDEEPGISTTPIAQAAGKDIDPLLPSGQDAAEWHSRMNEIQMLLHQSPVNALREDEDRYTINTVWPWGEGRLPQLPQSGWTRVWSDEAFTRGLAILSDTALQSVPEDAEQLMHDLSIGSGLLVLGDIWSELQSNEPDRAHRDAIDMDTRWWRPLWSALRRRELNSLTITDPARSVVTIRDADVRPLRRIINRFNFGH